MAPKKTEDKYRELVQSANSIIMRRDPSGTITFMNEFAQRFFGYSEEEILGRNVVGTIVPEVDSDGRNLAEMIRGIGRKPELYATNENENIRRNGERVWIAWTNNAIRDRNGNVREILCVGNDITERKGLEEQMFQARKMETVGRLAAGIAHDFNNILTAIIGCSELMLMQLPKDGYLYRKAELIKASGEKAAALTRHLLEFSRKRRLQPRVLDLHEMVSGWEDMIRRLLGKDIDLSMELRAAPASVKVDPGTMEQLLLHLALNAAEAMPLGGRLRISTGRDQAVPGLSAGPCVHLTVREILPAQEGEAPAEDPESFSPVGEIGHAPGLRLATVYELVRQCDGIIRVSIRAGAGSAFRIYFPGAIEENLPAGLTGGGKSVLGNDETVLVVEDEDGVRLLVREVLRRAGYTVLEALGAGEALEMCKRHQGTIHLMITDVNLPQLNGMELVRRLEPLRPEMKALYISGHPPEEFEMRGVRGEEPAFLCKPFSTGDLCAAVRRILDAPGG